MATRCRSNFVCNLYMTNTFLGLFAAAALCSGVARAVEPSASAQDRATLYQQEVRGALRERGWDITQDCSGKLVAERLYTDANGTTNLRFAGTLNTYARLQIYFEADGNNRPTSSAYASYCFYGRLNKAYLAYPPLALHDPKLTQEYRDILAEANSHVAVGHRTYGVSGKVGFQNTGNSDKVAMK